MVKKRNWLGELRWVYLKSVSERESVYHLKKLGARTALCRTHYRAQYGAKWVTMGADFNPPSSQACVACVQAHAEAHHTGAEAR